MFQFSGFPTYGYVFTIRYYQINDSRFPHSEIRASMDICSLTRLIAACHVLLRLLMPRHSPCALISLTLSIFANSPTYLSICLRFAFSNYVSKNCNIYLDFLRLQNLNYLPITLAYFVNLYYLVFNVHGGPRWTRTTDLTLIRRAL